MRLSRYNSAYDGAGFFTLPPPGGGGRHVPLTAFTVYQLVNVLLF